jgi:hypothetical protein
MRIPSGVTDQGFYFVAVDATDYVTRETGLSSFTVVRSRNGAADVTMTTPTITEIDSSTMPGVYFLLCDEDMTLAAGDQSQAMAYHITCSGMAPVTREIEIYRPSVTAGETLSVSSGALNAISDGLLTAAKFGSDFITAAKVASDVGTEIATAVWASATRLLTAGTNIVLAKGTGVTGFNDLDAAGVRGAVGLSSANLDTQLSSIDGNVDSILVDTAEIGVAGAGLTALASQTSVDDLPTNAELATALSGLNDPTAAAIADAVWEETLSDHSGTAGSTAEALDNAGSAGVPPTVDEIADEVETRTIARVTLVDTVTTNTDMRGTDNAALASDLATIDSNVDSIKAKTDDLTYTVAGKVDANIEYVNGTEVQGSGTDADPWGP